jgi:hypothetical protein
MAYHPGAIGAEAGAKSQDATISAENERRPKHEILHREIDSLDELTDRLSALLARITGSEQPPQPEEQKVSQGPTLGSILNEGADRINNFKNNAHDIINAIENELF